MLAGVATGVRNEPAPATATVTASYSPLEAAVHTSAGAFAGARTGFSATAGVAGLQVGVTAEAWSGVGAKAELDVGLHDGTLRFSYASVGGYSPREALTTPLATSYVPKPLTCGECARMPPGTCLKRSHCPRK